MKWLNEKETISKYLTSDFSATEKTTPKNNCSEHKVNGYNLPDLNWMYNLLNYSKGQHEIPLDETQITHEQRDLLRDNSLPYTELFNKNTSSLSTGKTFTCHEVFLAKRFLSTYDTDAAGTVRNHSASGTVYSRYSVFNNDLNYIRVDNLTEYHQPGSIQRRRKIESSFIRFNDLDKQTQKQLRMRLPEVNRALSKEVLSFISTRYEVKNEFVALRNAVQKFENYLNQILTIFVTQHEFDALVSLAYVHGTDCSTFTTLLNLITTFQFSKAAAFIEQSEFSVTFKDSESFIFSQT